MKKLLSLTLLFLLSIAAVGQARDFDGIWTGTLTTSNDDEVELTLYIDDNNVYSVYLDEDGDRAKYKDHEVLWSKGYGEQLTFVWMDKGGVWTETQVYSLVWSDEDTISVHHLRHVSNEDESYSNTDWGYSSKGTLRKE
ncbi:MAG: hypothetical protein ABJM06_04165 [Gilvibacter sp.]